MKWLITGDWQTRFNNLQECKQAHEQECRIIKEHKIGGHIDLGDKKDEYSPVAVEVVEFQLARTKNILDLIDPKNSVNLLGNHDRVGQHSDDRNWLSLFTYLGGHIITEPDVVFTSGALIFGLPYTREPKKYLEGSYYLAFKADKVSSDKPKILIFHQEVKDAKNNKLTSKRIESKITLAGLHPDKYIQCFGGHIHLRQKLAENVRYVGSPFSIDWGEIDQTKGFTIYDDIEDKVTFVESEVPGRYSYAYLRNKDIERVANGTQIKDKVLCPSVGANYHTLLEKRIKEISHRYPNASIQVVPEFETIEGAIEETNTQSTESEKLQLYVRASLPIELKKHKKKIQAYLQSVLERSLGRRIRSTDKVIFEKVEASNVLSFRHVAFDYRKRGTILIAGRIIPSGILASNGAGKTNLLSLPCVALEGRTFKGQTHDKWANWRIKGPALITCSVKTSKGTTLTIIRGRRPGKLQLLSNGKDISEGKDPREVQKQIEELTGYTFDTLANSVYVDQSLSNAFIIGTDKTRAELITKFQNIDKYELSRQLASKDMTKLTRQHSETSYELGLLKENLREKEEELKSHDDTIAAKKKAILKELKAEKKLLAIKKKRSEAIIAHHKAEKKILDEKLANLEDKEKDISAKIYMLKELLSSDKVKIKRLDKLHALGVCPECSQPISKDVHRDLLKQIEMHIAKTQEKLARLSEFNEVLKRKISKQQSEASKLDEKIALSLSLIETGTRRVRDVENRLETLEELAREDSKAVDAKKKIRRLKFKISAIRKYLKDIDRQKLVVAFAVETFSRKGFPAFLSKLVCPVLNKAAEYYSDLFLDGEIQVVFEVVKDTLTPRIINANGDKEIVGQSTGEKAWAGLIASFALREIAQPSNLLILDEPGHGLDPQGARRFGERIRMLEKRFDTILVTTHNVHIQSALDGVKCLEVVKENKISRLTS